MPIVDGNPVNAAYTNSKLMAKDANNDVTGYQSTTKWFSTLLASVVSTATQNALPTSSGLVAITGSTAMALNGITDALDGKEFELYNASSQTITIANASGSALAAERILTPNGASISVLAGRSVSFKYEVTLLKWIVTGGTYFVDVPTSLIGDVTGTGAGTITTTFATVTTDVGTFTNATVTVNGKGLVTAVANGTGGGSGLVLTPTGVKTSNYNAAAGDYVRVDASGGSFTVTLPTAVGIIGQSIAIDSSTTSANKVTIATTSGQTIGDQAYSSVHTYTQGEVWLFISNGTNWNIVQHYTDTGFITSTTIPVTGASGTDPTFTTGVTYKTFKWRRIGDTMYYRIDIMTNNGGGSNGTGSYLWGIPNSWTMTTDVQLATFSGGNWQSGVCIGDGMAMNSLAVNNAIMKIFANDNQHLIVLNTTNAALVSNVNIAMNNAGIIQHSWQASFPIIGWEP